MVKSAFIAMRLLRRTLLLCVPVIVLGICSLQAPQTVYADESDPAGSETVLPTVNFDNQDLSTVARWFAEQAGLNIIIADGVKKSITAHFKNITAIAAIRAICNANSLRAEIHSGVIEIKEKGQQQQVDTALKSVIPNADGTINVDFENVEVRAAVAEITRIAKLNVAFDAEIVQSEPRPRPSVPAPGGTAPTGPTAREVDEMVTQRIERRITYQRRNVKPEEAIVEIGTLAGLKIEKSPSGLQLKVPAAPTNEADFATDTRAGIRLELIDSLKEALTNMVTTSGKVAVAKDLGMISVYDLKSNVDGRVTPFLDAALRDQDTTVKNIQDTKDQQTTAGKLMVKTYTTVRDITNPDIVTSLGTIVSADGKVVVNADSETITVIDIGSNFKNIDEIMKNFNSDLEQVQINASVAEISLLSNESYGMDVLLQLSASHLNRGVLGLDMGGGLAAFGLPPGTTATALTFTNRQITSAIDFLSSQSRVHNLSSPNLVIADNQQAKITVGQEIPYLQSQSSGGAGGAVGTVEFKEVAIDMEVKPSVLRDNRVRLNITLTVKEQIDSVSIQGNSTPVLSNRSVSSNIVLNDGETLVFGGLLTDRERVQKRGIPVLSDLPIAGMFFGARNIQIEKTDLMFFIRPTIVGPRKEAYVTNGQTRTILLRETRTLALDPNRMSRLVSGSRPSDFITNAPYTPAKVSDNFVPPKAGESGISIIPVDE